MLITSVELAGFASTKNSAVTPGGKPTTDQQMGGQDDVHVGTLTKKLVEAPAGSITSAGAMDTENGTAVSVTSGSGVGGVVGVKDTVGVGVGGIGVNVGVGMGVKVGVLVGLGVKPGVSVNSGVQVGVLVGTGTLVGVATTIAIMVGVATSVGVNSGAGVGAEAQPTIKLKAKVEVITQTTSLVLPNIFASLLFKRKVSGITVYSACS